MPPLTNRNKYGGGTTSLVDIGNSPSTAVASAQTTGEFGLSELDLGGFVAYYPSSNSSSTLGSIGSSVQTALELGNNATLVDILNSTGKKQTEGAEYKYKIFIKFDGKDGNYYDDTLSLTVLRLGFIKSGTIFSLKINLTPIVVEQVKMAQNANKPVTLTLYIYSLKTDEGEPKLKNCVLQRPLIVRKLIDRTNAEIERGNTVMCDLYMSSVTLYNASTTFSYNKIHNTKTAYEVLTDYESFMKSTYGDNFEVTHVLSDKNEHRYEQIVTRPTDQDVKLPNNISFTYFTKTDIDVPCFLQYKYKITNSLGFYFYDCFNMKSKKEISAYFLSFSDKNKFQKFKIENQGDIVEQSQLTTSYPFFDPDKIISHDNVVDTSKLPNAEYKTNKTQRSVQEKGSTQADQKITLASGDVDRSFYGQKTTITAEEKSESANANSYQVPDSKENSDTRVNTAKNLFNKTIEKIDEFSTNNCGFDWLQFGVIYPMNQNQPNEYLHTPISIVNLFHRENAKENILSHMIRYQMIKFYSQVPEENKNDEPKVQSPEQPQTTTSGTSEETATKAAQDARNYVSSKVVELVG